MRILTRHPGFCAVSEQRGANLQARPEVLKPGREGVAKIVKVQALLSSCGRADATDGLARQLVGGMNY